MIMQEKKDKGKKVHNLILTEKEMWIWKKIQMHKIDRDDLKTNNDAVVDTIKKGLKINETRK